MVKKNKVKTEALGLIKTLNESKNLDLKAKMPGAHLILLSRPFYNCGAATQDASIH